MCSDRMSVLPPKLAHIWEFLPSGAKKMQTLLQPSASGESAFFWLLQARIPRREPPSAAGLLQSSGRQYPYSGREVCRFWQRGTCSYFDNCKNEHPKPPKCRFGNDCNRWPNCRFGHEEKICRFQENCLNFNCKFSHDSNNFLGNWQKMAAPNINSYQDFPQFPQQMWRPC